MREPDTVEERMKGRASISASNIQKKSVFDEMKTVKGADRGKRRLLGAWNGRMSCLLERGPVSWKEVLSLERSPRVPAQQLPFCWNYLTDFYSSSRNSDKIHFLNSPTKVTYSTRNLNSQTQLAMSKVSSFPSSTGHLHSEHMITVSILWVITAHSGI
ncbi:unnamed protein product [Nesidiocoris tenuis]|uniref:Uncharacterized protein n=1 Tax=Nesidiocoris tenuis TaxID=355587 RepID=A0A6H5HEM6_9HEMI|nr:unnamed protein product [Nesidiocoris tenuis]